MNLLILYSIFFAYTKHEYHNLLQIYFCQISILSNEENILHTQK